MKMFMNNRKSILAVLLVIVLLGIGCTGFASTDYPAKVMPIMEDAIGLDGMMNSSMRPMTVASMITDYVVSCNGTLDDIDITGDAYICRWGENSIDFYIASESGGFLNLFYVKNAKEITDFGFKRDMTGAELLANTEHTYYRVSGSEIYSSLVDIAEALSGD